MLTKHREVRKIKGIKGKLIRRGKKGIGSFLNQKSNQVPLFPFFHNCVLTQIIEARQIDPVLFTVDLIMLFYINSLFLG